MTQGHGQYNEFYPLPPEQDCPYAPGSAWLTHGPTQPQAVLTDPLLYTETFLLCQEARRGLRIFSLY